jgi:intracellular sulfur oxidation DsrE/DsrF family protein
MDRRNIFKTAFAACAGLFAARAATTAASAAATSQDVPKAVYHLSDLDKVTFVLGNMRNHLAGLGGPGKVKLALVVHGPPLKAFRADTPDGGVKEGVREMTKAAAELYACRHTMRAMKLELADLLPGFAPAEQGGVVKLAELQGQGFAYLRP